MWKSRTDEDGWEELPPSKRGYQANLTSLILDFEFNVKHNLKYLPRKKKQKVKLVFQRRLKNLRKEIERMYE